MIATLFPTTEETGENEDKGNRIGRRGQWQRGRKTEVVRSRERKSEEPDVRGGGSNRKERQHVLSKRLISLWFTWVSSKFHPVIISL